MSLPANGEVAGCGGLPQALKLQVAGCVPATAQGDWPCTLLLSRGGRVSQQQLIFARRVGFYRRQKQLFHAAVGLMEAPAMSLTDCVNHIAAAASSPACGQISKVRAAGRP